MFKSTDHGQIRFYWMQEPDDSLDELYCAQVNDVIHGRDPTPIQSSSAPDGGGSASDEIDSGELENLANLPEADRLEYLNQLRLAGLNIPDAISGLLETPQAGTGERGDSASAADSTPAPTRTPEVPPAVRTASESSSANAPSTTMRLDPDILAQVLGGVAASSREPGINLHDVLTPEKLQGLLSNEAFITAVLPLLPEGQQTIDGLQENIQSAQYAQALTAFAAALESEEMVGVMSQFGVDPAVVMANGGGAAGLLAALQKQADESEDKNE